MIKHLKFILSFLIIGVFTGKYSKTFAQEMFGNNANHNYVYHSNTKGPFNEAAWKFYADAPVRSTVAYSATDVFFGSSKGIFYALNKNSGAVRWVFNTGSAINSSAAFDKGNVFFSNNKQVLYSLNASSGKLKWKSNLGKSKDYEWAFDYYYSSPAIAANQIVIGGKDGFVYNVSEKTGGINWKFKTEGIVRSTPAVNNGVVYAGDTEGNLFAINQRNGKQLWRFETVGHSLNNVKFGFDRRAIIASPVIAGNKVIVGGRDGFLYAIDKNTGKQIWQVDFKVSWVISTVAVKGNVVVTGTSDAHFIEALDLNNGKQIWKYNTVDVVWSSPVIDGDKVYDGSKEGVLYCLNLKTGKKIESFQAADVILSSPAIAGQMLYFGSDDGYLYALKWNGVKTIPSVSAGKYVFFDQSVIPSGSGLDMRVKKYLTENGYAVLDKQKLITFLNKKTDALNSVIVFATNLFPPEITNEKQQSLLRSYLNDGGKIVVLGRNPLLFRLDTISKGISFRSFFFADSIINIKYGPDDLRSYKGDQPAFPTTAGKIWGLTKFWTAPLSISPNQVDVVLGMDENGLASAWVKRFNKYTGSGFVQIWYDAKNPDLSYIVRVAEYGLK